MKRTFVLAATLVALLGCGKKEQQLQPLDQYQSADVAASGNNFYVYPQSRFLPDATNVLRRAHFVLHPGATSAPPIACYESDATVQQVAEFYAQKYGYPKVAENEANNFSSVPPLAYYRSGDLQKDLKEIQPVMEKLDIKNDVSKIAGNYTGAMIKPKPDFPRVNIQHPYYDATKNVVVDKTIIVMVKE